MHKQPPLLETVGFIHAYMHTHAYTNIAASVGQTGEEGRPKSISRHPLEMPLTITTKMN